MLIDVFEGGIYCLRMTKSHDIPLLKGSPSAIQRCVGLKSACNTHNTPRTSKIIVFLEIKDKDDWTLWTCGVWISKLGKDSAGGGGDGGGSRFRIDGTYRNCE